MDEAYCGAKCNDLADGTGLWRCKLPLGHDGDHEWYQPLEFRAGPRIEMPKDTPETEWDGVSPINGEAVTGWYQLGDLAYVTTAKCVYRVYTPNAPATKEETNG